MVSTENLLVGSGTFLVSSGLLRSISKSTAPSLDRCARVQLNLGLSLTATYGLYVVWKGLR